MKRTFIVTILIIAIAIAVGIAQQTQQVIELAGLKKDVIFTRSLNWLTTEFVSAKAIIEMQDKNQGKIIGNINVPYSIFIAKVSMFTRISIEIQDNKARLTLIPIHVDMAPSNVGTRAYSSDDTRRAMKEYEKIVGAYKAFVEKEEEKW